MNNLRGKAKLVLHFLNIPFDKIFIFRKNDTIGILMLFDTRSDEKFEIRYKKIFKQRKTEGSPTFVYFFK